MRNMGVSLMVTMYVQCIVVTASSGFHCFNKNIYKNKKKTVEAALFKRFYYVSQTMGRFASSQTMLCRHFIKKIFFVLLLFIFTPRARTVDNENTSIVYFIDNNNSNNKNCFLVLFDSLPCNCFSSGTECFLFT